jgi:hypothetical protein
MLHSVRCPGVTKLDYEPKRPSRRSWLIVLLDVMIVLASIGILFILALMAWMAFLL